MIERSCSLIQQRKLRDRRKQTEPLDFRNSSFHFFTPKYLLWSSSLLSVVDKDQESTKRRRRLRRQQRAPKVPFSANCVMTRCGEISVRDVTLAEVQGPTNPKIRESDVIITQRKLWVPPPQSSHGPDMGPESAVIGASPSEQKCLDCGSSDRLSASDVQSTTRGLFV